MAKDTKSAAPKTAAPKATAPKGAAAPKAAAKAAKPAEKAAAPKKAAGSALMKPLQPSKELGAVVGDKPLPRTEVVSKVWEYIKSNKLQNPKNGREILADDKLQKVFGTDKVTMFEMNKHLNKHLA